MLSKIRHYVDIKSIYHANFESHLLMLHWFGHKIHHQLLFYKKTGYCFFLNRNAHTGPLFKNFKVQQQSST